MKEILIIDDDPLFGEQLARALQEHGYNAMEARNGTDGIELAKRGRPFDLILCDLHMEGVSGFSTLQALREDPKLSAVPFILMTGSHDTKSMRLGMELGADDYLFKPFTIQELFSAIEARFEKHQAIRRKTEKQLRELRASLGTTLPNELLSGVERIAELTGFIATHHRHLEQGEIVGLSKDVHAASLRLERLVKNCLLLAQLDFSVVETDPTDRLKEKPLHLRDLLERTLVEKARSVNRLPDLRLDKLVNNPAIQISADHFIKIIEEVLDNAFKFSKPRTVVHVSPRVEDGFFRLVVKDQGCGMTQAQIEQVSSRIPFERKFYQDHGSGLGLIIARKLAELNQGELGLESPGKGGATVSLSFPLVLQRAPTSGPS